MGMYIIKRCISSPHPHTIIILCLLHVILWNYYPTHSISMMSFLISLRTHGMEPNNYEMKSLKLNQNKSFLP